MNLEEKKEERGDLLRRRGRNYERRWNRDRKRKGLGSGSGFKNISPEIT